ncbi:hypothetical protein [Methanobrevibacter boviskoreani]|uniref:hypothetical protein n=1 Tax=Methanobrevibacter boviskoreani TaxID=1348249 RepID=UPI000593B673|nr:hypothetical protein [Methanobrevibacter boviskoreani]
MDYIILDNSDDIERAENQLFFTFQQEFTQKINFTKKYGNKHIENPKYYSKSKRIWFSRIKRNFESHYFFGFNYDESEKGFDAGKTILFLNFNIFGEKNNSHFLKDLNTNEIHCGINIYYRNYQSNHNKSEELKSLKRIKINKIDGEEEFLDLGEINNQKEIVENLKKVLNEAELLFYPKLHQKRLKYLNEQEEIQKESDKCEICDKPLDNKSPSRTCNSCNKKVANNLKLLYGDLTLNQVISVNQLMNDEEFYNYDSEMIAGVTTLLYNLNSIFSNENQYFFKINQDLIDFINKYSHISQEDKHIFKNIEEKKLKDLFDKIGSEIPYSIDYLTDELDYTNYEVKKIIKLLEERDAIVIDDEDNFYLIDKENLKKVESDDKNEINLFNQYYGQIVTLLKNGKTLEEVSMIINIDFNQLNEWIKKGESKEEPFNKLYKEYISIKDNFEKTTISNKEWKRIIKNVKKGKTLKESCEGEDVDYFTINYYIKRGRENKEYAKYYNDYKDALNKINTPSEGNTCKICNKLLESNEEEFCKECKQKYLTAKAINLLLPKLSHKNNFTKEELNKYYTDKHTEVIINNLKKFDLIMENKTLEQYYFREKNQIRNFIEKYYPEYENIEKYSLICKLCGRSFDSKYKFEKFCPKCRFIYQPTNGRYAIIYRGKEDIKEIERIESEEEVRKICLKANESLKYKDPETIINEIVFNSKTDNTETGMLCGKEFNQENYEKLCSDCIVKPISKYGIWEVRNKNTLFDKFSNYSNAKKCADVLNEKLEAKVSIEKIKKDYESIKENIDFPMIENSLQKIMIERISNNSENNDKIKDINRIGPKEKNTDEVSPDNITEGKYITSNKINNTDNEGYIHQVISGMIKIDNINPELFKIFNKIKAVNKELNFMPSKEEGFINLNFRLKVDKNDENYNLNLLLSNGWIYKLYD